MGQFYGFINQMLTILEVSSILSFDLTDTLGVVPWHQLRIQLLRRHGTHSDSKTKHVAWESTSLPFDDADIHMVANTRWLVSLA